MRVRGFAVKQTPTDPSAVLRPRMPRFDARICAASSLRAEGVPAVTMTSDGFVAWITSSVLKRASIWTQHSRTYANQHQSASIVVHTMQHGTVVTALEAK